MHLFARAGILFTPSPKACEYVTNKRIRKESLANTRQAAGLASARSPVLMNILIVNAASCSDCNGHTQIHDLVQVADVTFCSSRWFLIAHEHWVQVLIDRSCLEDGALSSKYVIIGETRLWHLRLDALSQEGSQPARKTGQFHNICLGSASRRH